METILVPVPVELLAKVHGGTVGSGTQLNVRLSNKHGEYWWLSIFNNQQTPEGETILTFELRSNSKIEKRETFKVSELFDMLPRVNKIMESLRLSV